MIPIVQYGSPLFFILLVSAYHFPRSLSCWHTRGKGRCWRDHECARNTLTLASCHVIVNPARPTRPGAITFSVDREVEV